jgi:titin
MTSGLTIIGYQIEQCAGACGGSNAPFAVLTPNSGVATASYVATGLVNGVSYTWRISAVTNFNGRSLGATVSVIPVGLPAAPAAVSASAGDGVATLTWAAPSTLAGGTLLGYKIETSINNGSTWTIVTQLADPAATNYGVSGLTNGTSYWFKVSTVTSVGTSVLGAIGAAIPFARLAAPQVSATPGNGFVTLVTAANQTMQNPFTGTFVGYRIEQSLDGVNWQTVTPLAITNTPTTLGVTIRGLVN